MHPWISFVRVFHPVLHPLRALRLLGNGNLVLKNFYRAATIICATANGGKKPSWCNLFASSDVLMYRFYSVVLGTVEQVVCAFFCAIMLVIILLADVCHGWYLIEIYRIWAEISNSIQMWVHFNWHYSRGNIFWECYD